MTNMVKGLTLPSMQPSQVACVYCRGEHSYAQCSSNPDAVNFVNKFNRGSNANHPYSNTYNPGWRQHPNFSLNPLGAQATRQSSSQQFSNRASNPSGFTQPARQQDGDSNSQNSMMNLLKDYISKNDAIIQNQQVTLWNLETQVGQLATALNNRPTGALPSDTEAPRIQGREEVKMIELRSGKSLTPMTTTKQPMVISNPRPEKSKEGQKGTEQPLESKQRQPRLPPPEQNPGAATLPPHSFGRSRSMPNNNCYRFTKA
ncbi:hypothetical protein QN277_022792 [Acacia crassicarpa]|uniref:Uncharacterized protein n=1 Tax=Acacia crassicarpa TaxID=499986 RepID=A0AAE1MLD3_9FABA|nr:hypothetical protein QN277_022792 [Acacia crassicarpa]